MGRPKEPDRSGQLSLFEDAKPVGNRESVKRGPLRFVDPDPSKILIGSELLGDFLKRVGEERVFLIRDLLCDLDWGPFERLYKPGGRPPYHPRLVLSIVFFGVMNGVLSLRKLEAFARTNLACWWLSGGIMPDHDTIADVLNRFQDALKEELFEQITAEILQATGSSCSDLAGDGTVVEAVASRYRGLQLEAAQAGAAKARKLCDEAPNDRAFQERLAQAEEVLQVVEERSQRRVARGKAAHVRVSPTEPEAVYQPSKTPATATTKAFAYSYKPSVLANRDRLIVAQSVHASSEVAQVEGLLDQAEKVAPGELQRLMLDAGYYSGAVAELALNRDLDLLCPQGKNPKTSGSKKGKKKQYFPKERFEYDAEEDVYRCPANKILRPLWKSGATKQTDVQYGGAPCKLCPLKKQCTAKSRRIVTRRLTKTQEAALGASREVMEFPSAIEAYGDRASMVEPVFAHMRQVGLSRFTRRGTLGAALEFALRSVAHNLKRFAALVIGLLGSWLTWALRLADRTRADLVVNLGPHGMARGPRLIAV